VVAGRLPDRRRLLLHHRLPAPAGFYIHGKVIEADYGTPRARIFIGSENFSGTSLNDNRELGLIISDHSVMSAIASTFASDFRNGQHWS